MSFPGFRPSDFKVFDIEGFAPRMDAIKTRIRPKLEAVGKELLPDVTRAIASCELADAPMVTARPSLANRPLTCAITKGAATASIGRSSVNCTVTGCLSSAALAGAHARPPRPASRAGMRRSAWVRLTRIELNHENGPGPGCRAGHL